MQLSCDLIKSNFNYFCFEKPLISKEAIDRVSHAALYVFKKLATALVLNIAIRVTFATFLVPQGTIITTLASLAFTTYLIIAIARKLLNNQSSLPFLSGLARSTFVEAITMKMNNYIHEYGHAIAAQMTYLQASSKVFATHAEGSHSYTVSYGLSSFGQCLGEMRSRLFITAAGLLTPIFATIGEFAVAYSIFENGSEWRELLIDHGFSQLANTIFYGGSTLLGDMQLENDFFHLWLGGGLHPLVTLGLLLAIPLAQVCVLQARSD